MSAWSEWLSFLDPQDGGHLHARFGPGVYELRHRQTGDLIFLGSSENTASRMSSLLPAHLVVGTRDVCAIFPGLSGVGQPAPAV